MNKKIIYEDYLCCAELEHMKKLAGKRILIIGASGMIGSFCTNVLIQFNKLFPKSPCHIIMLCRNRTSVVIDEINNVDLVEADINKYPDYNIEFDYAIFCAGYTDQKLYIEKPIDIYSVNLIGLHNMLNLACVSGCKRFLFISSASVYGNIKKDYIEEKDYGTTAFSDYHSVYQESKRMAECMCSCFSKQNKMDIKIVRPFHIYGPGARLDNSNMVNEFFEKAVKKENLILKSEGNVYRNFTYIRDIIWQLFLVLCEADEKDGIFNLGSVGNTCTVKEFAGMLSRKAGIDIVYAIQNRTNPTNGTSFSPDLKKINGLNQYKIETISLDTGIRRSLEYWI